MNQINSVRRSSMLVATSALASLLCLASSHREAPLITQSPKIDATDFYIFNSYEPGRSNYVTLVANYVPLQAAYGGPNYFSLDSDAVYEIHVDNNADSMEDLTFQFRFQNNYRNIPLVIGPQGNQRTNAVPLLAVGQITATNQGALNLDQTYTLNVIRGPRRTGTSQSVSNAVTGSTTFTKPMDNIGNKTMPNYEAYANAYMYEIKIPGVTAAGRVFVGQRKDPFVVNLGETFDLINISTSPLGPVDANKDSLAYANVTSLILEIPTEALTSSPAKPIIGAWTTASKISGGQMTQVSRLGMPLVNEVVIGLKDKDKFNASEPKDDLQFADYVTHPTLPAIIELLYGAAGAKAPTKFPRVDLLQTFATGLPGLNETGNVGEMIRLNTSIPALPPAQQKNLAALAGDIAGFPNGRRPGDDVVDIALRVAMGALLPEADAPSAKLPFTDGAYIDANMFATKFPYLLAPLAGSPNDPYVTVVLQRAPRAEGPYRSVSASFDQGTSTLSTARGADGQGYFKVRSDSTVQVGGVKVDQGKNQVQIGVK